MKKLVVLLLFFTICNHAFSQTEVKNCNELEREAAHSKPGAVILLGDGVYSSELLVIKIKGTAEKPIKIQAKNPGKVLFTSPVKVEGDYISLSGLSFVENGMLEISGKGCKVTNCLWKDSKKGKWLRVLPGSSEIEIAYNTFQDKTYSNQNLERDCQLLQVVVQNKNEKHHIHHNLFKDVAKGKTGNGFETLQLITEKNPFDPPPGACNTRIEDNVFIRCNGEAEIISVKSNGNIIRRNVFRGCAGGLVLRHGDNNLVTGNYLFGEGEPGSAGVRIQGGGQVVANNYFEDLGAYGLGMMDGTPDDLYVRVENAQILFNTFVNCASNFSIGINHSKHPNGTAPKDCNIIGNIFYDDRGNSSEAFIVFIQNDEPVNWTWKDNLGFGKKCPDVAGFEDENPKLERVLGLMHPTEKTKSIQIQHDFGEEIKSDLLGNTWSEYKTAGAIQYSKNQKTNTALTEEMVGAKYGL